MPSSSGKSAKELWSECILLIIVENKYFLRELRLPLFQKSVHCFPVFLEILWSVSMFTLKIRLHVLNHAFLNESTPRSEVSMLWFFIHLVQNVGDHGIHEIIFETHGLHSLWILKDGANVAEENRKFGSVHIVFPKALRSQEYLSDPFSH